MITVIEPVFSLSFEGNIWKVLIDDKNDLIALEIRDGERHQTTFALLALHEPQPRWQGFRLDEPWWVGLADFWEGILFFYQYTDIQKPEPLGIYAWDVQGPHRWLGAGRLTLPLSPVRWPAGFQYSGNTPSL
ncbi:MAG: DUF4905 domain-containing protein [Bacteroidia bacterium]|nr:DUF4905 domain-containing protein [Bacteroidia bacterium]